MTISKNFAKFASKTTSGDFDKVRKEESQAQGCPLPIGTRGVAIVGKIECDETTANNYSEGGDPRVRVILEVDSPEQYRGKKIMGQGLKWTVRETEKSTLEVSWQRMLDGLEALGLPREIRESYGDFAECINYFEEEPRKVDFIVLEDANNQYNRSGKSVSFSPYNPDGAAVAPTADKVQEEDPSATYVLYLGSKHKILEDNDGILKLQGPSGKLRENIEAIKVKNLDGSDFVS